MLTSNDICNKARSIAAEKTLYVKGGGGAKLTQQNKMRFSSNDAFNIKRTNLIFAASEDTRAFDEFGFLSAVSGYNCRTIGEVAALCEDISKDFSTIVPGEVVFLKDRFGIFVGDGKVITVNPLGIGETILDGWASHGKLPEVDYGKKQDISEIVDEPVETEVVEDGEREVDGDIQREETVSQEIAERKPAPEVAVRPSSFRHRH